MLLIINIIGQFWVYNFIKIMRFLILLKIRRFFSIGPNGRYTTRICALKIARMFPKSGIIGGKLIIN